MKTLILPMALIGHIIIKVLFTGFFTTTEFGVDEQPTQIITELNFYQPPYQPSLNLTEVFKPYEESDEIYQTEFPEDLKNILASE